MNQDLPLITTNSKDVQPGCIFVAVRGAKFDGHDFIPDAIAKGASVLVVEDMKKVPNDFKGNLDIVADARLRLAELASEKYKFPSQEMFSVGVTGTNGKTSVSFITEHLLSQKKFAVGVIGTVDHHLGSRVWPTEMTTPGPIELQARLREFVSAGATALSMEVSSHALDQKRVHGIDFDVAMFTNLTRDHLDYHKTFEDYFLAKAKLFTELLKNSRKNSKRAVINVDDEWGVKLVDLLQPSRKDFSIWTFGIGSAPKGSDVHLQIQLKAMDFSGTEFELSYLGRDYKFKWDLIGQHNIQNAVTAMGALLDHQLSMDELRSFLPGFKGVPGRLERVHNHQGINAFVDYAHTPDALENVLRTLQTIQKNSNTQSRIWTVFGCGGDRDKGKRPQMAAIAEKYSQRVVVTSDNPRTEDPAVILDEIKAGLANPNSAHFEIDRQQALQWVVTQAKPTDVILVAGKGHEDYQIIGTQKFPFSDQKILAEILRTPLENS